MDTRMYFGLLLTELELLFLKVSAETHLAVKHVWSFIDSSLTAPFHFVSQLPINLQCRKFLGMHKADVCVISIIYL